MPENPTNGPNYISSDVALEVGRVDMFNMIGVGSIERPWPDEEELLRNYSTKITTGARTEFRFNASR